LEKSVDNGEMGRRQMTNDDERLALKWLHGEDHDLDLGIEPGRAALRRLLQARRLSPEICDVLASLLDNYIAIGEWRLTLSCRRGAGRPPKPDVERLAKAMKVNNRGFVEDSSYRRAKKLFEKRIKEKIRKRPKPRKTLEKQEK
jgi:hypothetical protein